MDPSTSATLAPKIYPNLNGNTGTDKKDILRKLEPIYVDWILSEFSAKDSMGLAVFLDRAVKKFAPDSGHFRNILEQAAERLKAALPAPSASASLEPKDQIAALAGNTPQARLAWINYCAEEGILTPEEAKDLLVEAAKALPPPPPTPFEAKVQEIATFAMNDPIGFRRAMGHDLEQALAAHGGILASDGVKDLMKEKLNSFFEEK